MRVAFAVLPAVLALARLPLGSAQAQSGHHSPARHHGGAAQQTRQEDRGFTLRIGASLPKNGMEQDLHTGWAGAISRHETLKHGFGLETSLHLFQHEGKPRAEREAAENATLQRLDFSSLGVGASRNLTHTHRRAIFPGTSPRAISVTAGGGMYRFINTSRVEYSRDEVYHRTNRLNELGYNVGASVELRRRRALEIRYHRIGRGTNSYGLIPISVRTRF